MPLAPAPSKVGKFVEYDQYIDAQIHKTRWQVRSVDITTGLVTQLGAALAFFLAVSLVDHWLVPGGLGFWGRLTALAAFVLGEGWYFACRVWPPLVRRVNPVYAAETIERARPTLKNSLINFLFLRDEQKPVSPAVLSAIEEHAATRLSKTSVDGAVDTSRMLRMGYILAGAAIALALYKVASPKDPLTTVGRVLLPWADIQAPSRVAIRDVQPGDTEAARGQQIDISAEVGGLAEGDDVLLYYSTDDGQSADRPLPMTRPAGGYRFACQLPPDGGGLQQGARYRLAAGDARTRTYRLNVVSAPTIVVEKIDYEYPAYTGLLSHSVARQGDIKALEGTRVTLHALANGEIKTASVDLECDGRPDATLSPAGANATGSLTLSLKDPRPTSYQLLLTNAAGRQNTQPVRYTIDITPDLAPEIDFVGAPPDDVELPADGTLELEIKAEDPDFALSRVSLRADRGDRPLLDRALVEKTHRGQFAQKLSVPLGELGLKAGETIEYWAQADDNKRPQANRAQTARRTVRIVAPRQDPAQQPNQADKNQQPDQPQDRADQNGQQQPGQGDADNRGQDSDRRDPADSPRDQNENGQGGDAQQDQPEPGEGDNANDAENQQRDQGDGHERGDGAKQQQQPADKNENGADNDPSNGEQQRPAGPDDQAGENQQSGEEKSSGENPTGDKQPGEKQTGEQKGSQQPETGDRQQPGQGDGQPQAGDQSQGTGSRGQDAPNSPSEGNQAGQRQPSGAGQRGDQSQAGDGPASDQPVGSDGSDDGTAIERILQHQRENPAADNQKPRDDRGQGGQPADKTQPRGDKPNEKPNGAARGQDAGDAQGQPTPADPTSADDADRAPNRRPDQDPAGAGQPTQGEKPQDGDKPQTDQRDSPAGQPGDNQGPEGSGSPGSDAKGSPAPQDDNRPRDLSPKSQPKGNPAAKDAARSPSNSKHQSDSEGGAEGDRSGGGKPGGGQKSNQPGEGEAGQNTPADQGGGAAQEPGDGETGERGGDGPQAAGQTGQAGDQAGQGTRERRGDGNRAGGERPQEQRDNQGGQPGDDQPDSARQPNQNGGQRGRDGEGQLQGVPSGGQPHEAPDPNRRAPAVNEGADAPNLEYARKATDLALEHLKDQLSKDEPDPALLARLGWTREDLEKFVRRWESLRRDAQGNAAEAKAARRELDQSLRSLGLKPRDTALKSSSQRDDQSRGLKESRRTQPPAEYLERYKAYTQGTAKGK